MLILNISFPPVAIATLSFETFIGNALFGDGAGAFVVGAEPRGDEKILWEVEDTASLIIESTPNEMTWQASETGIYIYIASVHTYIIWLRLI